MTGYAPVRHGVCAVLAVLIGLAGSLCAQTTRKGAGMEAQFTEQRQLMVARYLVPEGIDNPLVLNAMRSVPRHRFVDPPQRDKAYWDTALPIGHKQTISPPFIVAYMTQMLDPKPEDKVLEIGTGSGYQGAVLGAICKDVYTIEIVEPLGTQAGQRFRDLNYTNVHNKVGDGYLGWPEHAPFDKIIVTCSPENVPQPLVDQLKEGGRMIVPLGERYQQVFYLFIKKDGQLQQQRLIPTLFVPMTGTSEKMRKVLPDPSHPELDNGSFEELIKEAGTPVAWHYQRQMTLKQGDAPDGNHYIEFENQETGRFSQCLQGLAVDGRQVQQLSISLWARANNVGRPRQGQRNETAGLHIHFFDQDRRPIANGAIPLAGSFGWKQSSQTIPVPAAAREAIVQLGLNGNTGQLAIDHVRLQPVSKN